MPTPEGRWHPEGRGETGTGSMRQHSRAAPKGNALCGIRI
nr:hypothetical protein [Escherichia coli]